MKPGAAGVSGEFQAVALERVKKLLLDHGLTAPIFEYETNEAYSYFCAKFLAGGHEYDISIQEDEISLIRDGKRYSSEMAAGYPDRMDLLDDFVVRLDRLLAGGTWRHPEEKGFLEFVRGKLGRFW
ncbi:MAG TPA: hypothetical protein VN493_30050 [Thermoanaerobaculia bacterium]|nr:hypothetical protein [Thermoanaerobaculia bacterium]